jgi:signal transduction histidine kinase
MKKIVVLAFSVLILKETFSQKKGQALADSLQAVLSGMSPGPSIQRAKLLNRLGKAYLNTSAYAEASACFFECEKISERLNEKKLLAESHRNIALIDHYNGNIDKSEEENNRSLAIYKELNDIPEQAFTLRNTASDYLELALADKDPVKNSHKAEEYYSRALQLFKQLHDKDGEAGVIMNQSILCFNDYQKKIELALLAKEIWNSVVQPNNLPTINMGNIGVAYLDIVRYDTLHHTKPSALIPAGRKEKLYLAKKYIDSAILMGRLKRDVENTAYFTGVRAELEAVKGDYKDAYTDFRAYQNITDSLFSQENKNKIAALESKNEIDKRNLEIEQEKLQVKEQTLQVKEQKKNTVIVLALLLIVAAVGFLYYRLSAIRRQKNGELIKLNKELDDANKLKAKFFGILSHDLRSPIANLVNFLTIRKIDPDAMSKEQTQEKERKISASAQTLLETMETMLLWSKGQMQHFKPELDLVRVDSLFAYLEKQFSEYENVSFNFFNDNDIYIETDENYLKTISYNLTTNAVKVLKNTAIPKIEWKAWDENGKPFLSISDNGPGIDNNKLKTLYDDSAASSSKHGLGLHIIRDLARAINCNIEVWSNAGNGTEFILKFPVTC